MGVGLAARLANLNKVLSVAKPELGSKHQCQNCGAKFFDLNKNPVVCPKCGTTQEVSPPVAAAPARASQRAAPKDEEEDERENESGAEVVSLEDADQTEDGKVEAASTDEDTEDDDDSSNDDDDAFLEDDEDDDGDVSDLVDNDREDDDER